jgi:hypothetical protein
MRLCTSAAIQTEESLSWPLPGFGRAPTETPVTGLRVDCWVQPGNDQGFERLRRCTRLRLSASAALDQRRGVRPSGPL